MTKRATEKNRATTPVVLGFHVEKRYKDFRGKEHSKTVSRLFASRDAADTFRNIAEKSYAPIHGHTETEVVFYTTEVNGLDDISSGV